MFKKVRFVTAVLAFTLLFVGAFQTSVNAESFEGQVNGHNFKIYYSVNGNSDTFSKLDIKKYINHLLKNYQFNWDQQTPEKEEEKQPEEDQKQEPETELPDRNQQEQNDQNQGKNAPTPEQPKPQQPKEQPKQDQGYQLNQYEQQVVELTNQERANNGLAPLKMSEPLSKVAREKSADMARNNYFAHRSPTYGSPFDMMNQFGISYRSAGENIAKGQRTPEQVVNAWMNSAGHRKNILNANFTHIGVGYIGDGNIWTQQFIGK